MLSFPFVRCQFTGGHFWSPSENSRLRGCGEDDVQVDGAWGVPRPAPRNHRLHGARGAARRQLREVLRHLVAGLLHHRDGHGQAALGGLGCFQSPRANISGEIFRSQLYSHCFTLSSPRSRVPPAPPRCRPRCPRRCVTSPCAASSWTPASAPPPGSCCCTPCSTRRPSDTSAYFTTYNFKEALH